MTKIENELLILLAYPLPTPSMGKRAEELLKNKMDWRSLERTSQVNKVLPYFATNLEKTIVGMGSLDSEKEEVLRRFQRAKARQRKECQHLLQETKKIGRALNGEGIRYLVIKGQYRALALYREPSLRYNGDIDLLVPDEGSFASARKVIGGLGYVPLEKTHTPAGQTLERFGGDTLALCDLNTMVSQEVSHYDVIKLDNLWSDARTFTHGDVSYPVASPEHETLMLCLHTFKHKNILLRDVIDMCLLSRRYNLDWSEIVRYAKHPLGKERITTPLQLIDEITQRYYKVRILPKGLRMDFRGAIDPSSPPMRENIQGSLEATSTTFPFNYNEICRHCRKCIRCPLIIFKGTSTDPKSISETIKNKLHRMLWDKMLIINVVAPTYGARYTIDSLGQFVRGQVYSLSFEMFDGRLPPLQKAFPDKEVLTRTSYIGILDRGRNMEFRVDGGEGRYFLVMFKGDLFGKDYEASNLGPFRDLDAVIDKIQMVLKEHQPEKIKEEDTKLPSDMVRIWEP